MTSLIGDILKNFFTEMLIEYTSMFHMTFVQIGEFDWLSGRQKGSIFVKMFNQRTNGPVNAHLISGPCISTKHTKPGKNKVKK